MYEPPPPRAELIWAAVDFDDTIAKSNWSIDNPNAIPGDPIQANVEKLWQLVRAGYKIAIHTSRSWSDYEVIESWMHHHGIPFHRIVCGKLLAKKYIDDRAVHADDDWL